MPSLGICLLDSVVDMYSVLRTDDRVVLPGMYMETLAMSSDEAPLSSHGNPGLLNPWKYSGCRGYA